VSELLSSLHRLLGEGGPLGYALAGFGLTLGHGLYLARHGRFFRTWLGEPVGPELVARVRRASERALFEQAGAEASLTRSDWRLLSAFYERWLVLAPGERETLREELAREGVDMMRLGDALRWHRRGASPGA
jgi:hypothetical protein